MRWDDQWCTSDSEFYVGSTTDGPIYCWRFCAAELGLENFVASHIDNGLCHCHESCDCLRDSSGLNITMLTKDDFEAPEECIDEAPVLPPTDDGRGFLVWESGSAWCKSGLDYMAGYSDDAVLCWDMCHEEFGDSLVAIDFWEWGACYC